MVFFIYLLTLIVLNFLRSFSHVQPLLFNLPNHHSSISLYCPYISWNRYQLNTLIKTITTVLFVTILFLSIFTWDSKYHQTAVTNRPIATETLIIKPIYTHNLQLIAINPRNSSPSSNHDPPPLAMATPPFSHPLPNTSTTNYVAPDIAIALKIILLNY